MEVFMKGWFYSNKMETVEKYMLLVIFMRVMKNGYPNGKRVFKLL